MLTHNVTVRRKVRPSQRERARTEQLLAPPGFRKGGFISSGACYNAVPFLKCQNTKHRGGPIERGVVMRLTFPHTTRNDSGFPGQGRSLRLGIRAGFSTTINNRLRSAIGDFVSHSRRPRRGQSGAGPLCPSSFAADPRPVWSCLSCAPGNNEAARVPIYLWLRSVNDGASSKGALSIEMTDGG